MKWMIPLALMLSGCNPPSESAAADAVFAPRTQALEQARAVGDQLNAAAATQQEQIEASTRP